MPRNTSFTLTDADERYIREQIDTGAHASASEVMREALKRMREDEEHEKRLDALLEEGLASPIAPDGVFERVIARIKQRA